MAGMAHVPIHWPEPCRRVPETVSSRVMSDSPNSTTTRHELLFLNYFRLAQALVYVGLAFTPAGIGWPHLDNIGLARIVAALYLLFAILVVTITHLTRTLGWLAILGTLFIDIVAAVLAITAMNDARIGIAMMLAVNLAAGALLLPLRLALFLAALATLGVLGRTLLGLPHLAVADDRDFLESGLFGMAYFAIVVLCNVLGRQLRASEALGRTAQHRSGQPVASQ